MSRASTKFLFDQDFAAARDARPAVPLAAHEAALRESEAAAHARGSAAGKAEALAEAQHHAALALEHIAATLEALKRELAAVEARLETEAVAVAVAVAKKLAPALIEREPIAEIAALVADCFRHLVAAPHLALRVSEAQHDNVGKAIEALARDRGLASRLIVLGEPQINVGDCRIEWADGGVRRDRAATEAAIDEAVARYIAARLAAGKQDPGRLDR
jgi:flagellar assembly protein FliH